MRFLILGQGLAGTLMAAALLEKGCNVKIVDPGNKDTSSRVAAGMMHPVTGRRLAKSWKIDELLPFAISTYRAQEKLLQATFLHELKSLELYQDTAHRNEWLSRSADPDFSEYTGDECPKENIPDGIAAGIGGIYLNKGAWLDTEVFLDSWRSYFAERSMLEENTSDEKEFSFSIDRVTFRGDEFTAVIDCRGATSATSSWFNYLPFNPAKGEVIRVRTNLQERNTIFHKSIKLIPAAEKGEFICGATFSWHALDNLPTEKGRKELEEKLSRMLQLPYSVIGHRAGVRPATKDRRPFVGQHPEIKSLFILNGLGAKGVLLAPFMAVELRNLMLEGKPVIKEVDIVRV